MEPWRDLMVCCVVENEPRSLFIGTLHAATIGHVLAMLCEAFQLKPSNYI